MPSTSTPTHKTRSVTHAQTITLQDMKTLLDNLKSELKQEIHKVNDKLEVLFEKVNATVDRVCRLEKKCHSLEVKVRERETGSSFDTDEVICEAEERHKRRKFLII